MLDNNTNKVIWIGVAIGVVTLVGAGAILLFPQITDAFKPMMRESMLVTQATPAKSRYAPEKDFVGSGDFMQAWKAYYFFFPKSSYTVPNNSSIYYGLDFNVNKDADLLVDISNSTSPDEKVPDGNDHDVKSLRVVTLTNLKTGEVQYGNGTDGGEGNILDLKANTPYHVDIKYRNESGAPIYDSPDNTTKGTALGFRVHEGRTSGLHVSSSNYKMNIVHF